MDQLSEWLEPLSQFLRGLGMPEPLVHWGHPTMMGIVVFVMGTFAGLKGWQGRLQSDPKVATQNRSDHSKVAPWMFLFISLGFTGGVLSLAMQEQPLLASPHFWTGAVVILLLGTNAILALNFKGDKATLRTLHAYLGTVALGIVFIHAFLGLQLGLSI